MLFSTSLFKYIFNEVFQMPFQLTISTKYSDIFSVTIQFFRILFSSAFRRNISVFAFSNLKFRYAIQICNSDMQFEYASRNLE